MSLDKVILGLILLSPKKRKHKKRQKRTKSRINNKNYGSICSLTRLLISKAIEKAKKTSKKEKNKEGQIIYSEEEKSASHGGYGTVSKVYGAAPSVKYTDYNKLFSHLGTFKTKGMYEDIIESDAKTQQLISSTREMVSMETMNKAAKHVKYFTAGESLSDVPGYVPPTGMNINSKDWEKYRVMTMMSIYKPLTKLMYSMA